MAKHDTKVYLTHWQRNELALTLDVFVAALRGDRELRVGDFQDLADEVRHFQQNPNPSHPGADDPLDRGRSGDGRC
jgi:hypothetical protein